MKRQLSASKSGIIHYARRNIDNSAISAFALIICNPIIRRIIDYTNAESARCGSYFAINKIDAFAFIAIQLCRSDF